MSVATIYNDGAITNFTALAWIKRQMTTQAANEDGIVTNFKTVDDTFELSSGTYRFDVLVSTGATFGNTGTRLNRATGNQTLIFRDSSNAQVAPGIGSYQRRDENAFTDEGYLIGVASSVSSSADTFTFNNHQLNISSTVFFTGSVPSGITANTVYGVSFSGISAANQPNQFKAVDNATGLVVNLGNTNTPSIWATLRSNILDLPVFANQFTDQRPSVARYRIVVPVPLTYTFSIRNGGAAIVYDGIPHGVTATLGGAVVPSRYMSIRITKTA